MKRILSSLITVTMILVLLMGCGLSEEPQSQTALSGGKEGLVIQNDGSETTVAWDEIDREPFEGEIVNGKGEIYHDQFEGAELRLIFAANGIEVSEDSVTCVQSDDDYSAELTGAEILETGKVYIVLSKNGEMVEGSEGGQGAQLIVFGDPNSRRAVKYLKMISVN